MFSYHFRLGEACSHIAGVLFKVEAGIKLGYTKLSKTSAACVWNRFYKKNIDSQPLSEINFSRSVRGRGTKRPFGQTEEVNIDPVDEEMALHQLKQIFPSAGILTKDDSDTDTASDDDELPSVSPFLHLAD